MTFIALRQEFEREHIFVVEIDLDFCSLTFGTSPCTATGERCYNTPATSKDLPNYNEVGKTYRFCSMRTPLPVGLEAVPNLESVSFSPSVVDLAGGLGVRARVNLTFADHPSSDIGIDPYLSTRSYDPLAQGTFWTKFRARNPYYTGRALRVRSGYLVGGVYNASNFQTRSYVIESIEVSNGTCTIVAKDPLKLADSDRAQAPRPSRGQLSFSVSPSATSFTLIPSGIGNLEYPSSGYVRVRSEVMAFSRSGDTMSVTRGAYNTAPASHAQNDTVQLCLEYTQDRLDTVIYDLLVNYAGVNSVFINTSEWLSEVNNNLPALLSALITEPTGVGDLLRELGEQFPHSLFWDERSSRIQMRAIKPPPSSPPVLNDSSNIVALQTSDEPSMRVSRVVVYFGQVDPTRRLNEPDNYRQTHVRQDVDSRVLYATDQIRVIYSRWISSLNKAAAVTLASRLGRRFSLIPRAVTFEVDSKDISTWTGDTVAIQNRNIVNFDGSPKSAAFQIVSVRETKDRYVYTAIEYNYADPFDEEPPEDVNLIIISGSVYNINIRSVHDSIYPTPTSETEVLFVVEPGALIGSTTTAGTALDTGTWPAGAFLFIDNRGFILGAGGEGGIETGGNGGNGGRAVNFQHPLTISNSGTIGGGGGGGGGARSVESLSTSEARGGGGAGYAISDPNGTLTAGGFGQLSIGIDSFAEGGQGGNLGEDGEPGNGSTASGSGGTAGLLGNGNSNHIEVIEFGTTFGTFVP